MRGETEKRWRELCEQAVHEQDANKLMKLIEEINQLVETKEERLLREQQEKEAKGQSADEAKPIYPKWPGKS